MISPRLITQNDVLILSTQTTKLEVKYFYIFFLNSSLLVYCRRFNVAPERVVYTSGTQEVNKTIFLRLTMHDKSKNN